MPDGWNMEGWKKSTTTTKKKQQNQLKFKRRRFIIWWHRTEWQLRHRASEQSHAASKRKKNVDVRSTWEKPQSNGIGAHLLHNSPRQMQIDVKYERTQIFAFFSSIFIPASLLFCACHDKSWQQLLRTIKNCRCNVFLCVAARNGTKEKKTASKSLNYIFFFHFRLIYTLHSTVPVRNSTPHPRKHEPRSFVYVHGDGNGVYRFFFLFATCSIRVRKFIVI